MSAFFLHEGVSIEYAELRRKMHPRQHLIATWLTERAKSVEIIKSFVEIIPNETAFADFMNLIKSKAGVYHLRFYASNEPHRSYFDYNPTKGPVFIDRRTPHWEAVKYYDVARYTLRPDDITVLTKQKRRCIPWCAPFPLQLDFDRFREVVPGFRMRRIADQLDVLKYQLLDENGGIYQTGTIVEPLEWTNVTKVLQLRKSQRRSLETEFRYQD